MAAFSVHIPKKYKSSNGIMGIVWEAANNGKIELPCIKTAPPSK